VKRERRQKTTEGERHVQSRKPRPLIVRTRPRSQQIKQENEESQKALASKSNPAAEIETRIERLKDAAQQKKFEAFSTGDSVTKEKHILKLRMLMLRGIGNLTV
jgi:hypothetical protein